MGTDKRINRAIGITDYFVSLPPVRYFLAGILILGILFGIGINWTRAGGTELLIRGVLDGVLILTLPALLSALCVKLMILKVPFRRIAATIFAGEVLYAIAYAAAFFLSTINPAYAQISAIFGAAVVFVLWYVIGRLVFVLRYRSFLFAGIQLLFHSAFLLSSRILYFDENLPLVLAKFYLAALILMGALYLFFWIINAPMKRSFGIASTDALALITAQWLYQSKELEKTFARVGEKARTQVGLMAFQRKNDLVLFVVPYVHFGPFGNLGGSEFSALIPRTLARKHKAKTLVFHGTVTHDLNPISSRELEPIINACNQVLREARFADATCTLSMARYEECQAQMLQIGPARFVSLTRAPQVTEDINFGVGLAMMSMLEAKSGALGIVADQHNCETGEVTSFEPGDEVSYNYLKAVEKVAASAGGKRKPLRIGIAQTTVGSPLIGEAGIKAAALSTDPTYLMIVIDCNGITPAFRDRILQEVGTLQTEEKVHVAVFTTDTHNVNVVRGVLNPLQEDESIVQAIRTTAQEALWDMQPARFYAAKKWFDTQVIGAKQSIEIVSTINSVIAVSKIVAPLILLGGIGAILLLLTKLG